MKKYILSFCPYLNTKYENTAFVKPKRDAIRIAQKRGFKEINKMEDLYYNKPKENLLKYKFYALVTFLKLKLIFLTLPKNSLLMIQYPIYSDELFNLVRDGLSKRKFKAIFYLHDLDSVRGCFPINEETEFSFLNNCDYLILHNNKMIDTIRRGSKTNAKTFSLGCFDYLLDANQYANSEVQIDSVPKSIVFTGNMEKASFVNHLNQIPSFHFHFYGILAKDSTFSKNVIYEGILDPESLISAIQKYGFGLIWDGDKMDELSGTSTGIYMKYNNPYKFSTYIAASLPIITSTEAGIARFVLEHNIGFCVDSLSDLDNIDIDLDTYLTYKKNIIELQRKIVHGEMLGDILDAILRDIEVN